MLLVAHLQNRLRANTQAKFCKRATKPTLDRNRHEMTTKQTTEKEGRRHNITYTQAGVLCFVGQEIAKFEVQFFVGKFSGENPCLRIAAKRQSV